MSARSFASGDAMAESEPDPVRAVDPLPVVAPDEVAQAIDTADRATNIRFIRDAPFLPAVAARWAVYRLRKRRYRRAGRHAMEFATPDKRPIGRHLSR